MNPPPSPLLDPVFFACLTISLAAGCSAVAGCVAHVKRRPPMEGVLLGLLLGPIGVAIECRHPCARRPPVDRDARDSLHSMMTYQEAGPGPNPRRRRPGRRG